MDAPDPDLATHLIAITPLTSGRSSNYTQTTDYVAAPEVAYLGVVEDGTGDEDDAAIARIEGVDTFTVVVFCRDIPCPSQTRIRWGLRPDGFAGPAPGGTGIVTLPGGWAAQVEATAKANAQPRDKGCWLVMAEAKT